MHSSTTTLGSLQFTSLSLTMFLAASPLAAQGRLEFKKAAPPQQEVLEHTRGGAYFLEKNLKQKYDGLLGRVARLKVELAAGRISAAAAQVELKGLTSQLDELRKEVDAKKTLVSVSFQMQTEEFSFDPGSAKLLVITADDVQVVGWDQPRVKCILEKTILGTGEKSETEEFKPLRLKHQCGQAPNLVGKNAAEWEAEEKRYLAGEDGKPLTEEQRASRKQLLQEIRDSFAPYRDFQGKEVDSVEIEGLTHEQGNRFISVSVASEGGGGMSGGDWRRHAKLTVYAPPGHGVLLRGCRCNLSVLNLKAPLVITDAGSHQRDYNGSFQIKGLEGNLALYNIPLQRLEQVHGDVKLIATSEYGNTGTQHADDWRTAYTPPPLECLVRAIDGNLVIWFAHINLALEEIAGGVDVRNEFGDTTLTVAKPLQNTAHRIVSEAGRIELKAKQANWGKLPILALTNHGSIRTNAQRDFLDETNFGGASAGENAQRNWRGMKTKQERAADRFFTDFDRPSAILRGIQRSAGLDLISRGGDVVLTIEP